MSGMMPRARLCATCLRRIRSTMVPLPKASNVQWALRGHGEAGPSTLPSTTYRSLRAFSTTPTRKAKKVGTETENKEVINMKDFPRERIRNLSIIAHIDHGKSTLADRLLQMTGTVPASANAQFLDKLKVERERGITVKAQTVSIIHQHTDGYKYLINLIDTPGHVDFSYEVSRSIGACEGGLILVDCTQGIQAQTLSVFHVALEADLTLLAVINKVDLPHASPEETSVQIEGTLGLESEKHMYISAKSGLGVEEVLKQIVESLPPPKPWAEQDGKFRALVFDTHYDHYRGVVALIRVFSGEVKVGDKIRFLQADRKYEVLDIGINNPEEKPVDVLKEGQVGYLICSMKSSEDAHIGDTICLEREQVEPLPGFKPMKAMVYAGVFPLESSEFNRLEEAIERLTLNDRSVTIARESSAALSQGFRLGFLGTLHMDVFKQRLEDEYDSNVIITAPTVPYRVNYTNGQTVYISNPTEFPDANDRARTRSVEEPMVSSTIIVPNEYIGQMMDLCSHYRGTQLDYKVMETSGRSMLKYNFPLSEIVTDFFSALKSASSGFASFDYEDAGYEQSDMVKMNIMLNGKPVDALAMIVHRSAAAKIGKEWVRKLKEVVPKQMFELAIQAAIGGKVVARETLQANRKDVTAGLYGGHFERKLKQLTKQKEGKKRLKSLAGNIQVPQSAFYDVLSSRPRSFSTDARRSFSTDSVDDVVKARSEPEIPEADFESGAIRESLRVNPKDSQRMESERAFPLNTFPKDQAEKAEPPISEEEVRGSAIQQVAEGETAKADVPEAETFDPITPFLDGELPIHPIAPESVAGQKVHEPLRPHAVAPSDRSKRLSNLHRVSTAPRNTVTASDVYDTYTNTYFSAARGQSLTPSELRTTVSQLSRLQSDPRRLDDATQHYKRTKEILQHLQATSSVDEEFAERVKLRVRPTTVSKTSEAYVDEISRGMDKIIILRHSQPLDEIKADIDFFLRMLVESSYGRTKFQQWWARFEDLGLEMDGHSYKTRLLFLVRSERSHEAQEMLQSVLQNPMKTQGILLKAAMAMYAEEQRWDVVSGIYTSIVPSSTVSAIAPLDNPLRMFDISHNPHPDRQLFTGIIDLLAYAGFLVPSLVIMQDMLKAEHAPHLDVYLSLFHGFAAYGEIGNRVGKAGSLFPEVTTIAPGRTKSLRKTKEPLRGGSGTARNGAFAFTDIWALGAQAPPRLSRHTDLPLHMETEVEHKAQNNFTAFKDEWTYGLLVDLFKSFLGLKMGTRGIPPSRDPPSPDDVWFILLAFSRTSGGDVEIVRRAWLEMNEKFGRGGQGGEKWAGWKLNSRLVHVVEGLERRAKE